MKIVVKKFGGTSVGSIEKIKKIAEHIAIEKNSDNFLDRQIVVVVSAMEKTTDNLFKLAYEISSHPNQRELDMLVTAGERITIALLSLALQEQGLHSISFTGSQSGIITDNSHGNAKILTVNAFRIPKELDQDKIVIVAGFQGVSLEKEITTLGRGGSDTTAVSLASYLRAEVCEIFTDVQGVFTADPRIVENVEKINKISYEEMFYLTLTGSKVLHSRAAEFALKYSIPVEIKSSFDNCEGTMIDHNMEASFIKAISHKDNLLKFIIKGMDNSEILLPDFKTEIFDMEYESERFVCFVESKYKDQITEEILHANLDYKCENVVYSVINILGYRICKDINFLNSLNKQMKKVCKNDYIIRNQGVGVSMIVNSLDFNELLQLLHRKYILSEQV